MKFLRNLFRRPTRRAIDPSQLMREITQLSHDVEKAVRGNDHRLKGELAPRVDELIQQCERSAQLADSTYAPIGKDMFVKVDMFGSQKLASMMLPLLEAMKRDLGA